MFSIYVCLCLLHSHSLNTPHRSALTCLMCTSLSVALFLSCFLCKNRHKLCASTSLSSHAQLLPRLTHSKQTAHNKTKAGARKLSARYESDIDETNSQLTRIRKNSKNKYKSIYGHATKQKPAQCQIKQTEKTIPEFNSKLNRSKRKSKQQQQADVKSIRVTLPAR